MPTLAFCDDGTILEGEEAEKMIEMWDADLAKAIADAETVAVAAHTLDAWGERCTACGAKREDIEDSYSPSCLGDPALEQERLRCFEELDRQRAAGFGPLIEVASP